MNRCGSSSVQASKCRAPFADAPRNTEDLLSDGAIVVTGFKRFGLALILATLQLILARAKNHHAQADHTRREKAGAPGAAGATPHKPTDCLPSIVDRTITGSTRDTGP